MPYKKVWYESITLNVNDNSTGTFSRVLKFAVDNSQINLTDGKFNYVPLTQF